MNWILDLFNKRKPLPPIPPHVGERWRLRSEDPWGSKSPPVAILDVQAGWVRYYMNRFFDDERMRIDEFTRLYKLEEYL